MNPTFAIRTALFTEHEALWSLFEELDEHHRLQRPDIFRKPIGARREPAFLDQLIAGPDSTILVAESVGTLLGFSALIVKSIPASAVRDARRFVEVDQFAVRADARRLGVGRALIAASRMWARERDVARLEVAAWSFNAGTIAFYRDIGFQPTLQRFAMSSQD